MTELHRRALLGAGAAAFASPALAQILTSAPPPDRELMVPVQGGRVYVRVNGRLDSARPPLILAHGGPGSNHAYLMMGLPLADERAVVLYDQLDCGKSDAPNDPANWTVPRFVSEIDAIRGALGIERCHVLGTSWGGTLAAEYAIGRPKGLASVILESPLISTKVWVEDTARLRKTLPGHVQRTLERCERDAVTSGDADCDRAVAAFYASFTRLEQPPAWARAYRTTMATPFNAKLYAALWGPNEFVCTGALKDYDAEPRLHRIEAPALYLVGTRDTATPKAARRFAARTPHAEVKIIEGASHSIYLDQPLAWQAALRTWMRRRD